MSTNRSVSPGWWRSVLTGKADCWSLSKRRRLVHPLVWFLLGFHGLPTCQLPPPDGVRFWSGSWCTNGWAEVVAGMHCPPHPRQCRWPGSCPADSASAGQSLPGEPPPGTRQRCLVEEAAENLPDILQLSEKGWWGFPWRRQREREAVSLFSGSWWQ